MDNDFVTIDARTGDYSGVTLTPAQVRTLNALRRDLPRFDYYGRPEKYETKKFELSQYVSAPDMPERIARACSASVYVYIVTGRRDDDGTMAAALCRKYRHLSIGPRGGIKSAPVRPGHGNSFRPVSLFDALNREYWY